MLSELPIQLYRKYVDWMPGRYLLRHAIRSVARSGKSCGAVRSCVDVGAGTTPYQRTVRDAFNVTGYLSLDRFQSDTTNIVADACFLPLAKDSANLVVCFETLQGISDYQRSLEELVRIVRPGGFVLVSFPFVYGECDVRDLRRWTLDGMAEELRKRGCAVVASERRGGSLFALTSVLHSALNTLIPGGRRSWRAQYTMSGYLRVLSTLLLGFPFVVLGWVAVLFDSMLPKTGLYMGGVILAKVNRRG